MAFLRTALMVALLCSTLLAGCRVVGRPHQGAVLSDREYIVSLYWERWLATRTVATIRGQQVTEKEIEDLAARATSREINRQSLRVARRSLSEINREIKLAEKRGNFSEQSFGFHGGVPRPGAVAPTVPWILRQLESEGWVFR